MTTRRDDGIEKHMVDEGVLQEDNLPVFANISVPSVVPKDDAASNSSEQLPNELAESRYTGVSVWRREYKNDCNFEATVHRKNKYGSSSCVPCPEVVKDNNKHKCGILIKQIS